MTGDRAHPDVSVALDRAAAVIGGASSVVLACHVKPDGDALGSMLAMHHVLQAADRVSTASFPSPFVVAPHYREMPGLELLVDPSAVPREPEVMITFDCGSPARLGDLEPVAAAAGELVVIDHHISNRAFGSVNVIDPDAAPTGSVVHQLIERMGLPLNRQAAVCLYTALVCDTGRFQYESTNAEVFELARELVEFDVPVAAPLAAALRGAPLRLPAPPRRRPDPGRADPRGAVRVDGRQAARLRPLRRRPR